MFCPNCGTENSRGQKFCTRCGTNLLAIDRAREIISEMSGNATPISPGLVFGTVAGISIFGFIAITIGVVSLNKNPYGGPLPVIFGLAGFTALVLICRYFLKLLAPPVRVETRPPVAPSVHTPPAATRGTTNRALQEAATSYHSVIEEPTQQFDPERRSAR